MRGYWAGCLAGAAVFGAGVIYSDVHNIRRDIYTLHSKRIKKPLRLVMLSDLHGKIHGEGNSLLIKKILDSRPDLVLMCGDIMTAKDFKYGAEGTVDNGCHLIRSISAHCPVYFIMGNHEERVHWSPWLFSFTYGDMLYRFRQAGATILRNENVYLPEWNVRLFGLNPPEVYFSKYGRSKIAVATLERMLGMPTPSEYSILLAHNPAFLPAYAKWGADLTLSGHYHGGIIHVPGKGGMVNPHFDLFPDFCNGLFRLKGKVQIVSRGIGEHTLPVRMFNPEELLVVDLLPAKRG